MRISLRRAKTFLPSLLKKVKGDCHVCLEEFRKMRKLQKWDWLLGGAEQHIANEDDEMLQWRSHWEPRIKQILCWNQEDRKWHRNPLLYHSSNYVFLGYFHSGWHPSLILAQLDVVFSGNNQHPCHDLHGHSNLRCRHHSSWHHLCVCSGRFGNSEVSSPFYLQKPRLLPETLLFCRLLVTRSSPASLSFSPIWIYRGAHRSLSKAQVSAPVGIWFTANLTVPAAPQNLMWGRFMFGSRTTFRLTLDDLEVL